MDYSSLIKDYLADAETHLGDFDDTLLSLERDGFSREIIQGVLGCLHTLKGNSGMMGFERLKAYIHEIEEVLKTMLEDKIPADKALAHLFDSANVIRDALLSIGKDPLSEPDFAEDTHRLRQISEGNSGGGQRQAAALSSYLGSNADTIKVDFKRLDDLLNLIGELVIFKTRVGQIEQRIKQTLNSKSLARELNEGLQLIGKTVSELQEKVMKIRMLPVKVVFAKFARMVRDIAVSQGKEVSIAFEGEDTELDKTVIDEIGEPLLHIIRNAIDHGIETPEERMKAGKSPEGKLVISASQESSSIIVRVRDDGRGIDVEKIREKAAMNHDEALQEDIVNLIFTPGFTTKEETSDISGRGIGLDVANRNISRLNGQIMVDSTPGMGSTFTIKLPLSLAIIPALMAETAGEIFAIPMSAVEESVKIRESQIHIVNKREVIRLREQILPIVRLNRFFSLAGEEPKRLYLVVVRKAEKRLAVAVDRLRGQQEIVIKPFDDTLGKAAGIAGASILGDGRVVLIVDTNTFWNGDKAKKEAEDE